MIRFSFSFNFDIHDVCYWSGVKPQCMEILLFQFYCVAKMPKKFTNLPTIMSSRSVDCGLIRVQMSMVNRVLLLLKMEAKEDIRAANITASIRPRKPAAERRQGGRWAEDRGQGEETSPVN